MPFTLLCRRTALIGLVATLDPLLPLEAASSIPADMVLCHTAPIDGYVSEVNVPVADIRLMAGRPDAIGLSVPGMPCGSSGMGPESEREAYEIHLIRRAGTTGIFTSYDAA